MRTIYLAKYRYDKPNVAKANIIKESDLTVTFANEFQFILGRIWGIESNRPVRLSTLKRDGVVFLNSLQECFEYLRKCAREDLQELEQRSEEIRKQLQVFDLALSKGADIEEIIKRELDK